MLSSLWSSRGHCRCNRASVAQQGTGARAYAHTHGFLPPTLLSACVCSSHNNSRPRHYCVWWESETGRDRLRAASLRCLRGYYPMPPLLLCV